MPLLYYVQNSAIGIILVAIMLLYSLGQGGRRQAQDSLFVLLLLSTLALLSLEMLRHIFEGRTFAGSLPIHTVCVFFFFLFNPLLGYFYFLYLDQLQNRWGRIPQRMGILGAIPLLINSIFVGMSLFNGMVFSIDVTNSYARGPYFFLVPLSNLVYLVGGQAHNILHMRNQGKRLTNVLNIILPIPLILASMVQALDESVSMLFLAVAFTLLMTYLHIQNNHASRDFLTSLYNRSVGEQSLSYMLQHTRKGKLTGGMLMDIDGFKEVNDQFGHDTGDRCLRKFAHLLTECFSRTRLICRYGEDEFLVFGMIDSVQALEEAFAKLQKNLAHFNAEKRLPFLLSVSIGKAVAEEVPTRDYNDFLKHLDEAMYLKKRHQYVRPEEPETPL